MGYRKAAKLRRTQYVRGHYRTSKTGKTYYVSGHVRNDYGSGCCVTFMAIGISLAAAPANSGVSLATLLAAGAFELFYRYRRIQ
jgi:hypothetical protein